MEEVLHKFEEFLSSIPLSRYRDELLNVKTVEQDLPKSLNPLPAIYGTYWTNRVQEFPQYEKFFSDWWESNLKQIDKFVQKYFWGCSWEFVRTGFKARLYRTFVSVLTQFHFCYSWLTYCRHPLEASWELDMKGVDAVIKTDRQSVALQIKKETYRAEAEVGKRFARKKKEYTLVLEIPYTLTYPEEWLRRSSRARSEVRREHAELFYFCASKLQRWLENGFVVFRPEYPIHVEGLVETNLGRTAYLDWREVMVGIKKQESL